MSYHISHPNERHQDTAPVCANDWSSQFLFIIIMKYIALIGLLLVVNGLLHTSKDFEKNGNKVRDGVFKKVEAVQLDTVCNNIVLTQAPYNYSDVLKTGYLRVGNNKGNSALSFFFYGKEGAKQDQLKNYPTLIWLNGGPGSSSQLGNFMELGPFWIQKAESALYKIVRNEFAWTKQYNILFVDQPVGTGLSYADTESTKDPFVHSMDDVASDFYNALNEMYNSDKGCFKALGITGSSNLFIFGESYAGKYVPAIAKKILVESQNGGFLTGLRGAAIGDGFTHPYYILAEMGSFAYNVGLIDFQERVKIEQLVINSTFQEKARQWDELHNSFEKILNYIVQWTGGVNVYDFTSYKSYPTDLLEQFFWNPTNKNLFKLNSNVVYGDQAGDVYQALFTDFMQAEVHLVQQLLRRDLPVLIYNGQNDIIVENPGTMRWVDQMFYKNTTEFKSALFNVWKVNGKTAGSQKKVGNLDFRIVNNAGHLVPMDQGLVALEMVKEFVNSNKKN